MSHFTASSRRRLKVHAASLGPFLCWSIVFADIGTSIYFVPGIVSSSGSLDRVRHRVAGGVPVLHLMASHVRRVAAAAAG